MDPSKYPPYGTQGQQFPYPQPGYPQPGYSQPGYPPQSGFAQPGYPPQPGMPGGIPPMGFTMPMRPTDIIIEQPEGDKGPTSVEGFSFTDGTIRRAFIRKVYVILSAMLFLATGVILIFSQHEGVKQWTRANPSIFYVALIGYFITSFTLLCCDGVRRKAPGNFIGLILFTLSAAVLAGFITARYKADTVLIAIGVTAIVCLGLSLFAFQTKWDFTKLNGALFVALLVLFVLSIVGIFVRVPWWHLMLAGFSAVLFSIYLIHDTQMIIGGNHKYTISPEEYIFAALTLFLDIFQIFLNILQLIGAASGD